MRTMTWHYALTSCALALAACASGPGEPLPAPAPAAGAQAGVTWPVGTRAHMDLWLHGFALISDDTPGGAAP